MIIRKLSFLQYVKHNDLDLTLSELSKETYSWDELNADSLPDGVDPARLEKYLCESEFEVRP